MTESISSSLSRDCVTVPGQNYALISFVGPDLPQKSDKFGIKIRGCFNTIDEAKKHVKFIMDSDSVFDVYVVNMYEWLLIPPDNTKIDDVHYQEEYLETMIQTFKQNNLDAKKFFEQRKQDVIRDGIDKHLSEEEKIQLPENVDSNMTNPSIVSSS